MLRINLLKIMIYRTVEIDNNKFYLHIHPQIIARELNEAERGGKRGNKTYFTLLIFNLG